MGAWLAEHGLELALAIVSGSWFVSRTLVNVGEWKRGVEVPHTLTEERLQHELLELSHKARSLIVADLNTMVQRLEKKVDDATGKSSDMWSKVQGRIGGLEIQIAKIETRLEERG